MELILGSIVTRRKDALTWYVGLAAHVALSVAVAFIYGRVFDRWGGAGWRRGVVIGFAHAAVAGMLLWLIATPPLLPQVGDPALAEAGFLGISYGFRTALGGSGDRNGSITTRHARRPSGQAPTKEAPAW